MKKNALTITVGCIVGAAVLAGAAYGVWRLIKKKQERAVAAPDFSEDFDLNEFDFDDDCDCGCETETDAISF